MGKGSIPKAMKQAKHVVTGPNTTHRQPVVAHHNNGKPGTVNKIKNATHQAGVKAKVAVNQAANKVKNIVKKH